MRFVAQFLLTILFIIVFLAALLSGAIKFQLLDYNFWTNTFTANDVYQKLAVSTKSSFELQITSEGGSKADAKVLTDLITTGNVQDFVNKNIQNILTFANGKAPQIIVYVPVDKLPKSLLPKSLNGIKSEMTLSDLLTKFNYRSYSSLSLTNLAHAGEFSSLVFFGAVALLLVIFILLIVTVESGGAFTAPGITLLITGLLTISVAKVVDGLKSIQNLTQGSTSYAYSLVATILPPILTGLTKIWYIIGIGLIVIGLLLFFVKKPKYNNLK